MPVDRSLPPPRLSRRASVSEIVRHFREAFGVRVDLEGLELLAPLARLRLAGARLPEPPEAVLLDRILQVVPLIFLAAVDRVLIVDSGETGRLGSFDSGIVRVRTPALHLHQEDPDINGHFSLFTTTVLHEIGHAAYERILSKSQCDLVLTSYLAFLDRFPVTPAGEPSEAGVQHHFVAVLLTAILGQPTPFRSVAYARSVLADLRLISL
jgi:hypothetical protein